MLEAVPRGVVLGAPEPVRARQVDDDGVGRRHECGRALVVEAAKDEVWAGVASAAASVTKFGRLELLEARVERAQRACRPGESEPSATSSSCKRASTRDRAAP